MHAIVASARWSQLDGVRRGLLSRCELYARYTLNKICLPDGFDQNSTTTAHDWQAVGAQAVNHLSNKIMLALFAPSRPFFRCDADQKLADELGKLGITADKLQEMMAQGEKAAVAELDRIAMRPKLYEAIKHLIITGNVLLILPDNPNEIRVLGMKKFVVRRSLRGTMLELLIRDQVVYDELDPDVRKYLAEKKAHFKEDDSVSLYTWIKRNDDGDYVSTQWVDEHALPEEFSGKWPLEQLPYRVLTWDLADGQHYGTGLVEDYEGDFAGLSTLSQSQVQGAVLASEFRWLVNPAGMTKPEDFMNSENGSAIPGNEGDVSLIQNGKAQDLQVTVAMASEYVTRIGRGFLLGSAVTRQAERVTAEEIRLNAMELETSLGGAYSRLAVDAQLPIAYWLLRLINLSIDGTQVKASIVTGLEALSRNGDRENLMMWLSDMGQVAQLPEAVQARLHHDKLAKALAAPQRIKVADFMKTDEEVAKEQADQQQQALDAQGALTAQQTAGKVVEQQAKG